MQKKVTLAPTFEDIAKKLCSSSKQQALTYAGHSGSPMPSLERLEEMVSRLRAVIFPGYYGSPRIYPESLHIHIAASLDSIYRILQTQILRGICFTCAGVEPPCHDCGTEAEDLAYSFMKAIPKIRDLLATDVHAAFIGDPAAKSPGETIFCYPSIRAMTNHRIAHELYRLGVPLIPRIISEMSHSTTGIDIHPGAQIDSDFFIDHGTGVVIGETCVIGKGCRLYQGVTLGALSFVKDEDGMIVKGQPRHPHLEDNVTVYSGATILGNITIGKGSVIGGNVWLTHDTPENTRVIQQRFRSKPEE